MSKLLLQFIVQWDVFLNSVAYGTPHGSVTASHGMTLGHTDFYLLALRRWTMIHSMAEHRRGAAYKKEEVRTQKSRTYCPVWLVVGNTEQTLKRRWQGTQRLFMKKL